MKRILQSAWVLLLVASVQSSIAQDRYLDEVFDLNEITVTSDIVFGTNIDFLTSDFSDPMVFQPEVIELQTAAALGTEIPAPYFNPLDETTAVKVTNVAMDIYQPDPGIDTETERPVIIYIHTGNFLPPVINGSPNGTKTDSAAIVLCQQWAQRGYVAVSVDYRLGWNPISEIPQVRRGTLLNAVYRAIHDTKKAVRTLKLDAADGNTYGINPDQIVLYGQGSGGYVSQAYVTLDDAATELFLEKFLSNPFDPTSSYVDTLQVGNLEGQMGALTLYQPDGADSEVRMSINAGGALADESWLEAGDVPMCAINCIRDDFAPFDDGVVIVPVTQEEVVPVNGANTFIQKANDLGNNDVFAGLPDGDPFTDAARALYGTTHDVSLGATITVNSTPEGLLPILLPLTSYLTNQASPWEWWDPNSPFATAEVAPGITTHMSSLQSNPDMSPEKGRAYLDSIQGYILPRITCALDLPNSPCEVVEAPANDDCPTATDLTDLTGQTLNEVQVSDVFSNVNATTNNDPSVGEDGDCWFGQPLVSNTVWFTFEGDGNQYDISTGDCNGTAPSYITDGDTQMIIFTGSCGDFTEVGCNEDSPDATTGNFFAEVVDLVTEPGVTYYIMIDGYQGVQGDFCVNMNNNGLSISEMEAQRLVNVYPNPAQNELRIDADGSIDGITIFDAMGRMVVAENAFATNSTQLDISALADGVYSIQLTVEGITVTKRFLKK